MPGSDFPHLSLIQKVQGDAKLPPAPQSNERVTENKSNYAGHGEYLGSQFRDFTKNATKLKETRKQAGLPEISGGVPFLLQIPDEDDEILEWLSAKLGLEFVAEYEDGYVLVATEEIDLNAALELANDFIKDEHGAGKMASILEVYPDPLDENRIKRILDDELFAKWPFNDDQEYILDVSIEVAPMNRPKATPPKENPRWKPETNTRKQTEYLTHRDNYWQAFDELKDKREDEVLAHIKHYQGSIGPIVHDDLMKFPDSFSMRIKMNGQGFTDLIINYPNLFEISIPDEVEQPYGSPLSDHAENEDFELMPPDEGAPAICIIDSGIQEQHRWLANAILTTESFCFIPNETNDDVADYVKDGGHGTRVASACLYPNSTPTTGDQQAPFWLLNARVLDDNCGLRSNMFPADLLNTVVSRYSQQAAIYQHSIAADRPCRLSRMSTWATAIDYLSCKEDVLFLQAAGNLPHRRSQTNPSIVDHIQAGREYPDYLLEDSCRIANPAQSLQALTVGSISTEFYKNDFKQSVAASQYPSSFTRSGFGIWKSIKPEVVEFGGDYLRDTGNPPTLSLSPEVCPEMARSTLHGGPAVASDAVGTSFATPKVAHIAGLLAAQFPDHSTLLYRALIINSARWPEWADNGSQEDKSLALRTIGYGLPSIERATDNNDSRVTLIPDQDYELKAGEGMIFSVPIPEVIRAPSGDYPVRIDVTLSYASEPRRTRKSRRGYLGVWLDWKCSNKNEPFERFKARTIKDMGIEDSASVDNFEWMLGTRSNHGQLRGTSRSNGTAQKDWTVARSYELPDSFGVAIHAHKGWDRKNSEATARFNMVVSFEVLGSDVKIYEEVEAAIQSELQVEQEARSLL